MMVANNKTQEYITIINPFIKYLNTNWREVPLKIPPGKQFENQRGRFYKSIQVQIRDLIKIFYLPEMFSVNGLWVC